MNLKDAFAGIRDSREEAQQPSAQAPKRPSAQVPKSAKAPLPLGKTGKSSHPEFEPVKIYLRKQTRKAAWRKWEDANGGDFSDLVQHLLEKYLGA